MSFMKLCGRVPRPLVVFGLCCICLGGVGMGVSGQKRSSNDISLDSLDQQSGDTIVGVPQILPQVSLGHYPPEGRTGGQGGRMPVIQELEVEDNGSRTADASSSDSEATDDEGQLSDQHHRRHEEVNHAKPTKSTTTSLHQLPFCSQKRGTEAKVGTAERLGSEVKDEKVGKRKRIVEVENGKHAENSTLEEVDEDEVNDEDDLPLLKRPGNLTHKKQNSFSGRHFLVATLDGKVTLLNQGGEQMWSVATEELFSSTISQLQLSENGKWVNLIPSLTGGMYKFDGESLVPMLLMNADSLLKRSLKHSNDVVISGGKEMRTYGVDIKTGSIRYECGISGCVSPSKTELDVSPGGDEDEERINLVITQQLQTVRAIDSMSGSEKWNFSVGTHELKLARVDEGCYEGEVLDGGVLDYVKVIIPEGRILGADKRNHAVWDKKFESPIAQAWVLEHGRLIKVDPILNTPIMEDPPALYVGKHNHQYYVQESHTTISKLENALAVADSTTDPKKSKPLAISWKPSSFIFDSGEETALTSLASVGPNLRPFFVLEKDEIYSPNIDEVSTTTTDMPQGDLTLPENMEAGEEDEGFKFPEFGEDDGPIEIINQVFIASLWYWWKEVLGISLLTAVLLNIILMKPLMRAVRMQTIRDMLRYFQDWKNQDQQEGVALVPIQQREVVEYRFQDDTGPSSGRNRTVSSSSNHSQYVETPVQEFLYSSQYLREFDPVQCLGKGGFGVVFEAKKKIDDRNYAVKRIALPNREKARVRVMREVKALAQLDHKNIVRYFNAWIEHPPNGWLENNDPLWNASNIGSPSPTYEYPSDLISQSFSSMGNQSCYMSQRKRPDHSKISFPPTPIEDLAEDSYIVFEASENEESFSSGDCLRRSPNNHVVPVSNDISTTSSISGNGFWKRPTTLDIPSSCSNSSKSVIPKVEDLWDDEDLDEVGEEACENESSSVMYLYIQQELCQKRTLQDWLRAERARDIMAVVRFFAQIVEAVQYVHSKRLIHRDLKPSNIFLAGDLSTGELAVVKIGDFGLATTALAELEAEQKEADGILDTERPVKANLTGHVGTHLYMSPEQFQRKPYDYKVDIYSLGLIFFELLVPFSTEMERHEVLCKVRKLDFPSSFVQSFSDEHKLIQEMISHNPNNRPDAMAINVWVQSHLQKMTVPIPTSNCSLDMKTHRSQSSPAHMNAGGLEKLSFPYGSASSPKRKFFKTHSTTTM